MIRTRGAKSIDKSVPSSNTKLKWLYDDKVVPAEGAPASNCNINLMLNGQTLIVRIDMED